MTGLAFRAAGRTFSGGKYAISGKVLHPDNSVYIAHMLATPELLREAGQFPRLAEHLRRWRSLPLYRQVPATGTLVDFQKVPLLTKRRMREGFPGNFLPDGQSLETLLEQKQVELEHTSGTSEERLPVVFGRNWWNEQEQRALRLNGFVAAVLDQCPDARRATIVPPACNGLTCPTVWMSREQRTLGNTLYVNLARIPFLLTEEELGRMAAEISEWLPQFLDLDPVHGARFALFCEAHGIRFPSLRFLLCSYEFVSTVHRRILERVFGVPVFNLYGSTETGHLLMENEHGEMKCGYDTAFLEIVNADADGIGDLVVTTLTNDYMPLLRYRIGDLVQRQVQPYGNHFTVHGRARDVLPAAAGRRVTTWQVDQCLAGISGIVHYELRQLQNGAPVLRFVPDKNGPSEADLRRAASRLEALLDLHAEIRTEPMTVLLPSPSGKFRLIHPVE